MRSLLLLFFAGLPACIVLNPHHAAMEARSSLVAADQAFARWSAQNGVKDALAHFAAEDGVNFQPHPVKPKETVKRNAASVASPEFLNWEPIHAEVSQAGDMGFTTGVYTLTDPKQSNLYRLYFSVWRKREGEWKVAIDATTPTPSMPANSMSMQPRAEPTAVHANRDATREHEALFALERTLGWKGSAPRARQAYLGILADHARLHRDHQLPLVGKQSIESFLVDKAITGSWHPIGGEVARSNDLAYTYGRYELTHDARRKSEVENGYYIHAWRRDGAGRWKIVLETHVVVSAAAKVKPQAKRYG